MSGAAAITWQRDERGAIAGGAGEQHRDPAGVQRQAAASHRVASHINYNLFQSRIRRELEGADDPPGRRQRPIGERVVDPAAIAPVVHEARPAERSQVMRDERLTERGALHQVGNTLLAGGQQLEEEQSRFIAQGAKAEGGHGTSADDRIEFWHARSISISMHA